MIFLDSPNFIEDKRGRGFVSDGAEFLRWLLLRMSVPLEHVWMDYVLKCHTKSNKLANKKAWRQEFLQACMVHRIATLQEKKPAVVVVMGSIACEAFLGDKDVGTYEGARWTANEPQVRECGIDAVWVTYSPAYGLQDPAESVTLYRTLFRAAEEAGLNPEFNPKIAPFDYGT